MCKGAIVLKLQKQALWIEYDLNTYYILLINLNSSDQQWNIRMVQVVSWYSLERPYMLMSCVVGCDRRVLQCVILLFSHLALSVWTSLTLTICLWVCVWEYVCVLSVWSIALAQKERAGRPALCFASCRKLAANCGSMRRWCFVWPDKVQMKLTELQCLPL